jgi:hypothetical protein
VLRQVLEWGLTHGQGWKLDRHRPPGQGQRVSLRLDPKRREQVEAAATTAGGDISAWLRHAVDLVTMADFPASWQATSSEQTRAPQRSHDSRQYGTRFMLRLDDPIWQRLEGLARDFDRSIAEAIRPLVMQAQVDDFPKSWHLVVEERRHARPKNEDGQIRT